MVVGGGPVGVEMVGEIADKHKDKNLTLITANEKLVSQDFNEKFYKNINSLLDSMKVKVGGENNIQNGITVLSIIS